MNNSVGIGLWQFDAAGRHLSFGNAKNGAIGVR
jgi:hypothetical protein